VNRIRRRAAAPLSDPAPVSTEAAPAPPSGAPGDELEESPLAQRLQQLDWPAPPPEVKERCLEQIMARVEQRSAAD
jgi:hypothetical protein